MERTEAPSDWVEPCRHVHQRWRIDGKSGHCTDCGAQLTEDTSLGSLNPKYSAVVELDYTNYRGERSVRRVGLQRIRFAATKYHPDAQWLLHGWDFEKQAWRDFAMQDIHSLRHLPYPTEGQYDEGAGI